MTQINMSQDEVNMLQVQVNLCKSQANLSQNYAYKNYLLDLGSSQIGQFQFNFPKIQASLLTMSNRGQEAKVARRQNY